MKQGLLALAAAWMLTGPAWAEEFRMGALMIDTGPLASFYESGRNALLLAEEEINAEGGIGGDTIKVVIATHAGTPEAAMQAAARLVQREHVNGLTGMLNSSIARQLLARSDALGVVVLDPFSTAVMECRPNFFRFRVDDPSLIKSYEAFVKESGITDWDILAADYTAGHESAANFSKMIEGQGGTVHQTLFAAMGTTDFGAQIIQLLNSPSKGLFVSVYGTDAVVFSKQQSQFGVDQKFSALLGSNYALPSVLQAMGKTATAVTQPVSYAPNVDIATNATFAQRFRERFGSDPDDVAFDHYIVMHAFADALRKAGSGRTEDLRAALAGLELDTPLGPLSFRAEDHQILRPIFYADIADDPQHPGRVKYDITRTLDPKEFMVAADDSCATEEKQ